MKVAIIPARGGSKRIPRKNIKAFCGKPMIAHSIAAAQATQLFDRIIVSTDDEEIAGIARAWGAEVPFLRPLELSGDYAGTIEVIAHATDWLTQQENGTALAAVCCLYATAPFVLPADLIQGWRELSAGGCAYAFSVTDFAAPILRAFKRNTEGGVEMFFPENFDIRSQDLPQAFHDAGQFYWGTPSAWLNQEKMFAAHSRPIVIPRWRVQDIDTPDDWVRAELLAAALCLVQDK